jgi:mRNA-degrading endonuclease RelE of RelBE toxin-antitoxin system
MTTRVQTVAPFDEDIKRLQKKYPSVRRDIVVLIEQLRNDERPGDKIPNVGYDVYKVRIRNASAQRGKRGGFRVVYYLRHKDDVFLIAIYAKVQQADISPEQIRRIIDEIS